MRALPAIALLALLAGCASPTEGLRRKADALAAGAGMQAVQLNAGMFNLLAYERIADASAPVHVYIEGDGNAWLASNMVSPDPTPLDPVALKLALRDKAPNVVYLARVCQYVTSDTCSPRYWTYRQYGEETIGAYRQAMQRWQGRPLELTGYSGGAAVAMLLAARLDNVAAIRTVAGNIDTDAFTTLHHISPFSQSLNPASVMERTARIPQRHFVGEKDKVVPPSLIEAYQARLPAGNCSAYDIIPGLDHFTGWEEQWAGLLARPLPCR